MVFFYSHSFPLDPVSAFGFSSFVFFSSISRLFGRIAFCLSYITRSLLPACGFKVFRLILPWSEVCSTCRLNFSECSVTWIYFTSMLLFPLGFCRYVLFIVLPHLPNLTYCYWLMRSLVRVYFVVLANPRSYLTFCICFMAFLLVLLLFWAKPKRFLALAVRS